MCVSISSWEKHSSLYLFVSYQMTGFCDPVQYVKWIMDIKKMLSCRLVNIACAASLQQRCKSRNRWWVQYTKADFRFPQYPLSFDFKWFKVFYLNPVSVLAGNLMSTDQRRRSKFNVTSISKGGNMPKWRGRKESPPTPPTLSCLWEDQWSCQSKGSLLPLPLLLQVRFMRKSMQEPLQM